MRRILGVAAVSMCAACARTSNDARASTSARLSPPRAPSSAQVKPPEARFEREGWSSTLALGRAHSCAIVDRGQLSCWGANDLGQLGLGRVSPQEARATPVPSLSRVVEIAAGRDFTCARESDGAVWCWGALPGRGSNAEPVLSPSRVLAGARRLFAAESRICVLSGAHGISCWGDATYGDLGDGSNSAQPAPVPVASSLPEIAGLSLSYGGGCVWASNGRGECWGRQYSSTPGVLRVPFELPGVTRLALGSQHNCALFAEGRVGCSVDAPAPRPHPSGAPLPSSRITELSLATELVAGGDSACALESDGAAACWFFHGTAPVVGSAGSVKLDRRLPSNAGKFVEVAIGSEHWCARRSDGRVECWGKNDRGQLGDGTMLSRAVASPVLLPGEATPAPPAPKPASDACEAWSDCALDAQATRCVAVGPTQPPQPSYAGEAYCACSAKRCERRAVAPVTCTQDSDCWFTEGFPRRPAARRRGSQGSPGPFRACVDGDRAPICIEKRCGFGKVYGC